MADQTETKNDTPTKDTIEITKARSRVMANTPAHKTTKPQQRALWKRVSQSFSRKLESSQVVVESVG